MSEKDFLGRVVNPGFQYYYFELCDICEKRPPNWLKTNHENNVTEIRVSCNECHDEYLNQLSIEPIADDESEFEIYDEVPEENEDITPVERPSWVQDFIDDASESGAIETIGGSEEAASNIDILEEMEGEPIENEPMDIEEPVDLPSDQPVLANWSADFIKEALFGQNPEQWLEEQEAYSDDNISLTIKTLEQLSTNQVTNVKITAIHCLNGAYKRNSNLKSQIIESLNKFIDDLDEMVVTYAQDTINGLK